MPKVEKKKKSSASRVSPLTARPSLETEIRQTQDRGILRPIKPAAAPARNTSAQQSVTRGAGVGILRSGATKGAERIEGEDDDEEEDEGEEKESGMIPQSLSRKIMQQAQTQQREEEELAHEDDEADEEDEDDHSTSGSRKQSTAQPAFRLRDDSKSSTRHADNEDEDESDEEEAESVLADDEEFEELELSAEDERALAHFLPSSAPTRRTLADLIMEKLSQHTAASAATTQPPRQPVDPKVAAVYTQVGVYLSHYTSGKIPKAFKIVSSLQNWEEVLALTSPDRWTPAAVSAATRLFASGLNERMAQRYYSLVVLPRVRSDIAQHNKLNYHLYQSLRRAIFKPAAFFRGLVLPWASGECDDGDMTLREAVILSSVLAKYSVPPLHAAACMLRLLEMPYSGPVMLLILTLINKRYSLPVRVVDALSRWFGEGAREGGVGSDGGKVRMPLVWHKGLLCFVQRYGGEMNDEQVKRIREVTRAQVHSGITKEVRRELMRVKEKKAADKLSGGGGMGSGHASVVNTPASAISVLSAGRVTPTSMDL